MKVIVTGSTGNVGQEIVAACLKNQLIQRVYSVSRRPLPPYLPKTDKLTQLTFTDLETFLDETLEELRDRGVTACIWCLGGAISRFKDHDEAMAANVGLPLMAANKFIQVLCGDPAKPFRFIYMSVAGAEQNQFRSLWVQAPTRKMKGAAERGLLELAKEHNVSREQNGKARFEVYCLRLGKVLEGGQTTSNVLREAMSSCISTERVARKAVLIALDGLLDKKGMIANIVENSQVLGEDWAEVDKLV